MYRSFGKRGESKLTDLITSSVFKGKNNETYKKMFL